MVLKKSGACDFSGVASKPHPTHGDVCYSVAERNASESDGGGHHDTQSSGRRRLNGHAIHSVFGTRWSDWPHSLDGHLIRFALVSVPQRDQAISICNLLDTPKSQSVRPRGEESLTVSGDISQAFRHRARPPPFFLL